MKPEFIAFNKATKKMFMVNDINGLLQNTVVCCKHGDACECMAGIDGYEDEVDLYPYIHRKDKDGNKVYEGSLFSDGGGTYVVYYDKHRLQYMAKNTKNKEDTHMIIHTKHYDFIGHIAEEG